jgi:tetratricopeptide (TPR) repeat protein
MYQKREDNSMCHSTRDSRSRMRAGLLLVLAAVLVYANTLANDFVAGDRQLLLRNPALGSHKAVLHSFAADYWAVLGAESYAYYRPVVVLSHYVDWVLFGKAPAGHHLSNIVYHCIAVLLVFRLFVILLAHTGAAAAGALLFAMHPAHTHSVSYVVGRTDVLAAIFFLAALVLWLDKKGGAIKTALCCVCYLAAMLCKEIAVTLPAVVLLCRYLWPGARKTPPRHWRARFVCLFAPAVIYGFLRWYAVGLSAPSAAEPEWYSLWQQCAMVPITLGFYAAKLMFPVTLCYYSNLIVPETYMHMLMSPYFITGCTVIIIAASCIRRVPRCAFGACFVIITLMPVLNIIPLPECAKENYLYLPSIGFCLMVSLPAARAAAQRRRKYIYACIGIVCLFYGVKTVQRNLDYRSPVRFLQATLEDMDPVEPKNRRNVCYFCAVKNHFITYRNLGRIYFTQGEMEKAARAFEQALRYAPPYFSPRYADDAAVSLGRAYEKLGRYERAAAVLTGILPATGRPAQVHNLLGVISIRRDDYSAAQRHFEEAVRLNPGYASAHYNLGLLYLHRGDRARALSRLHTAARLDPRYRVPERLRDSGE